MLLFAWYSNPPSEAHFCGHSFGVPGFFFLSLFFCFVLFCMLLFCSFSTLKKRSNAECQGSMPQIDFNIVLLLKLFAFWQWYAMRMAFKQISAMEWKHSNCIYSTRICIHKMSWKKYAKMARIQQKQIINFNETYLFAWYFQIDIS